MLSLGVLALVAAGSAVAAPTSSFSSAAAAASSSSSVKRSSVLTADGFTSTKWVDAFKKAQKVVAGLTLAEKVNFTDLRPDTNGCSGLTYPIPSAGIPAICYGDGPTGANSRYSTQFPTEVTTASTWDKSLFTARANAMGEEYHQIGVHVPLSIVAGPMGRSPYGGRNWENFSPDPYLTGEATKLTVEGFQKNGVTGLVKHFFGNEQEYLRIGAPAGGYFPAMKNQTVDSVVGAAATRELYAWPFAEAVRSGAGAVMCSYNMINGTVSCENDAVLNGLLKEELGFGGFVLTDWGAAYDTAPAALNGTDYVEGVGTNIWGAKLGELINNGTLPDNIIDDKLVRILTPYFALDQSSLPDIDFDRFVASEDHKQVVRDVAEGSLTLLKNVRSENSTRGLPLNKPKDLILVGSAAAPAQYGIISNEATAFFYTSSTYIPGFATDGFGSGGSPAPYAVDPLAGITARGWKEERPVVVDGYFRDDPTEGSASVAGFGNTSYLDTKLAYASSAVVFVSAVAMEGYDRENLDLANGGNELISYVAKRHNDTIVVVTAPGPIDMSAWIDHANVSSVLYAYFPTVEGGNAMASVLFGDVSPSGKLPFTIAKNVTDYPDAYYNGSVTVNPIANFTEGVFIDYKHFDAKNITPLYEFGYGMSYSNFSFADLKVSRTDKPSPALVRETNEKLVVDGELTSGLYDVVYTVEATVSNIGSVAAAEVAQLYLSFPSSTPRKMPVRSLRGFEKPLLEAGASTAVSFELRNKDLAYYSPIKGGWVIPEGDFKVSVGSSSRKLPLSATFQY
ncbi:hypothetical protein JCM11641_005117 [Rhodosporidiobolus odoratus]